MAGIKAKWKRAPMDQRRLNSDRTIPRTRFTRSQRSGSLPPALPSGSSGTNRPLLKYGIALAILAVVSIALVIGVGSLIHAEQQYEDLQWRAQYYGRPTLPFSTLAPDFDQQISVTDAAFLVTPLPGIAVPVLSSSSSEAALTEPDGSTTGDKTLSSYCAKFGVPVSLEIFDWDDWSTVKLDNPMVAQLPTTWDASANIWQGYNSKNPLGMPSDAQDRWRLKMANADGTERWMYISQSASNPDTLYVMAFQNIAPFADTQGNHYGYHPCRDYSIPATDMNILLSSTGAAQSSTSQFPAFVSADDPRWVQGRATPISGGFDLRSIPTVENNEPLQTVSQSVSCFFITDVDWGAWAQVKIGNTTAWVDTSTVRLDAS